MKRLRDAGRFWAYLDTVALVTARAHARSGQAEAIAREMVGKRTAIYTFARRYAAKVAQEHATFSQSLK
ncbi:hypothetical protein D3C87_2129640 [compost metagenome]